MTGSILANPYPNPDQWWEILNTFDSRAVAHKLLLAHIPYVFRKEPLKFSLFRRIIGDAFHLPPTNVFIVGSAMAGRSLKGKSINSIYSSDSDIDTLIVSETLFTEHVIESVEWIDEITRRKEESWDIEALTPKERQHLDFFAKSVRRGIWRPDALPHGATARDKFFDRFSEVSLSTLGLQLSEDTVAKVTGRVARSFDDAAADLAGSLRRLKLELEDIRRAESQGSSVDLQRPRNEDGPSPSIDPLQ